MVIFVRLIFESFRFAWTALRMNLLRTVLSLLGSNRGDFQYYRGADLGLFTEEKSER